MVVESAAARWIASPAVSLLLVSSVILPGGCATNPVTGQRELALMSEAQEIRIGQELDAEIRRELGLYDDPDLQRYVNEVGQRLARNSHRPELPWQFAVVDAPAINAFALPGGYIYLTRGIMPFLDDEAQLAGVLGHEIGHVTARHAVQRYSQVTSAGVGLAVLGIFVPAARPFQGLAETALGVLFLKHSRDDELQADRLGVEYASRTGWDPAGVPGMLTTLARIDEATDRKGVPNWLATHPHPADRVDQVRAAVDEARRAASGGPLVTDRDGYLRRIDGIVFGDNPEDGIVRGAAFLHPDLRFTLTFPRGWEITNSRTQVVARQPEADIYMLLQLDREPKGRTLEEVAVGGMRGAGFRQLEGRRATINGLEAYIGTYEGTLRGLGRVLTRAAHIMHERNVYVLAGMAQPEPFQRVEREFGESIGSFRPLSRAEAAEIRPNRIDIYVVQAGDTWASIAERAGEGIVRPATLAIMNNAPVDEPPRPGERIKIVVGG